MISTIARFDNILEIQYFPEFLQLISHIERIFSCALALLPSSSIHRAHAVELRNNWRCWLDQNRHLVSCSSDSKSLVEISVDAEIQHMLQALAWKSELELVQHATPEFSREAYTILIETDGSSGSSQILFDNMGGCHSR
jgi:hypothetical protein